MRSLLLLSVSACVSLPPTTTDDAAVEPAPCCDALAPSAPGPVVLTATGGELEVMLTWSQSAGAENYLVHRATAAAGPYLPVKATSALDLEDESLAAGTTYHYYVEAKNKAGASAPSNVAVAVTAPRRPSDLQATPGATDVTLTWTAAQGASGYIILRADVAGGPYVELGQVPGPAFVDDTIAESSVYYYVVRATNPAGASPESVELKVSTLVRPPESLSALAVSATTIALTWVPVSVTATSLRVDRSANGGAFVTLAPSLTPDATGFDDSGVVRDAHYVYRVYAWLDRSSVPAEANVVSFPKATIVAASMLPIAGTIQLDWSDTNAHESSYVIERSSDGVVFSEVATASADATAHQDTGLASDSTYYYRVNATNASATEASNVASAHTYLPMSLAWSSSPVLDATCTLTIPASVTSIDARAGFASAVGSIGMTESSVTANATGISAAVTDLATTTFSSSWSVTDSLGGTQMLSRDLRLDATAAGMFPLATALGATVGLQPPSTPANCAGCCHCATQRRVIVGGSYHSCAVTSAGTLKCWGYDNSGELGDGTTGDTTHHRPNPVDVICGGAGPGCAGAGALLSGVRAPALGNQRSCVLLEGGTVKCWGLGLTLAPADVICQTGNTPGCTNGGAALTNVIDLTASQVHSCAVIAGGTVKCWGGGDYGVLGIGYSPYQEPYPRDVICSAGGTPGCTAPGARLGTVVAVSAGWHHTCALLSGGTVKCWGSNTRGQLGDGTTGDVDQRRLLPVDVVCAAGSTAGCSSAGSPLSTVIGIAAGFEHTCALLAEGTVKCWGSAANGELGDGTTGDANWRRLNPVDVTCNNNDTAGCAANNQPLGTAVGVATGWYHSCALLAGGTVKCWGQDGWGALGGGSGGASQKTHPADVTCAVGGTPGCSGSGAVLTDIVAMAVGTGSSHNCVVHAGGSVACWGNNALAPIGDGTVGGLRYNPTQVCATGTGATCVPLENAAVRGCSAVSVAIP